MPLLVRNVFTVSPRQIPRVVVFTFLSLFNSGVGFLLRLIFAKRIRAVELHPSPVFILGHWRSGTTLLHELLSCDPRFIYPKGYQCGSPHTFLLLEPFFRPFLKLATPSHRPMDAMAFSLERPQEDEYALLGLLGKSTLKFCMFPASGPTDADYLSLRRLTPAARQRWIDAWVYFLKSAAARHSGDKRFVLKSPQHTARVRTILSVFPDAKFVHITRNPLDVFASTVRTWHALSDSQGLQGPGKAGPWAQENVLSTFAEMYACYHEDHSDIPAGNLIEIRYDDLVADPVAALRLIYRQLDLGDIDTFQPALFARLREAKDHRTNVHRLSRAQITAVAERWSAYVVRYGYANDIAAVLASRQQ